ncbi:MAG: MBL fold metallo-hydrolase [Spirochaetaceae bacterium]|nr:MBL fold metallo-hydrolase [Spirochaetaceae bacterium]
MIERLRVGPIGENAYIVVCAGTSGGACVLVDPGDEAARILSFLDSRALAPSYIVVTHGHLDHTSAIPELLDAWTRRGRTVRLAVHALDAAYFGETGETTNRTLFAAIGALGYFKAYWRPMPEPDLLLNDGDLVPGSPLRVIHTPGHTAGSICLYDREAALLLSGDTLFQGGVGRTDGPDSDPRLLESSLARLFSLPAETTVLPGHGEATSIGSEIGTQGMGDRTAI